MLCMRETKQLNNKKIIKKNPKLKKINLNFKQFKKN